MGNDDGSNEMSFSDLGNDEGSIVMSFSGLGYYEVSNMMGFSGWGNDDEGFDAIRLSDVQEL